MKLGLAVGLSGGRTKKLLLGRKLFRLGKRVKCTNSISHVFHTIYIYVVFHWLQQMSGSTIHILPRRNIWIKMIENVSGSVLLPEHVTCYPVRNHIYYVCALNNYLCNTFKFIPISDSKSQYVVFWWSHCIYCLNRRWQYSRWPFHIHHVIIQWLGMWWW